MKFLNAGTVDGPLTVTGRVSGTDLRTTSGSLVMGSDGSGASNYDGITYDDSNNTFYFLADSNSASTTGSGNIVARSLTAATDVTVSGGLKCLGTAQLPSLATNPASPASGSIYLNSTSGLTWYNGTAWDTALTAARLGAANGVAPLDANSSLPLANLPASALTTAAIGVANGVAPLDANNDVPLVNLPDAIPRGTVGYYRTTADTTSNANTTSAVAIPGFSTGAITLVGGRRYRISFQGMVMSSVANDRAAVWIMDGASAIQAGYSPALTLANNGYNVPFSVVVTPTAGTHTYNIGLCRLTGTGNINLHASSILPAELLVEDIGI